MNITESLANRAVIPLVQADDPGLAVSVSCALAAGGLQVTEVVLRTDRSMECLEAVAAEVPQMIVGAGTVLNVKQTTAAISSGAQFVVSPGLDEGVVAVAQECGVPVYPGVMTPGELQRAFNLGLDTVKFFPASVAGGVPALKAMASVFRTMKFIPTGGVNPGNLAEFLTEPAVLACGGSWLTPADAVVTGDFERISELATAAVHIARAAKGHSDG